MNSGFGLKRKKKRMKKCYYHTPDGELHGLSDLDFLVREIRYGALPPDLMIREEQGQAWIAMKDYLKCTGEVKLLRGLESFGAMCPESSGKLRFCWYRSWRLTATWSARSSRRETAVAYWLSVGIVPPLLLCAWGLSFKWFESMPFGELAAMLLGVMFTLVVLLYFVSLGCRRVHDAGMSGFLLAAAWLAWLAALFSVRSVLVNLPESIFLWMWLGLAALTLPAFLTVLLPEGKGRNQYGDPPP